MYQLPVQNLDKIRKARKKVKGILKDIGLEGCKEFLSTLQCFRPPESYYNNTEWSDFSIWEPSKKKQKYRKKPFCCSLCNFAAKLPSSYKNHILRCHEEEVDLAVMINCPHCPFIAHPKTILQHVKMFHTAPRKLPVTPPVNTALNMIGTNVDKVTFYCRHCSFSDTLYYSIKKHVLVAHFENVINAWFGQIEGEVEPETRRDTACYANDQRIPTYRYCCRKCGAGAATQDALIYHILTSERHRELEVQLRASICEVRKPHAKKIGLWKPMSIAPKPQKMAPPVLSSNTIPIPGPPPLRPPPVYPYHQNFQNHAMGPFLQRPHAPVGMVPLPQNAHNPHSPSMGPLKSIFNSLPPHSNAGTIAVSTSSSGNFPTQLPSSSARTSGTFPAPLPTAVSCTSGSYPAQLPTPVSCTSGSFPVQLPSPVSCASGNFSAQLPSPAACTSGSFPTQLPTPVSCTSGSYPAQLPTPVSCTSGNFPPQLPSPVACTSNNFPTQMPASVVCTSGNFLSQLPGSVVRSSGSFAAHLPTSVAHSQQQRPPPSQHRPPPSQHAPPPSPQRPPPPLQPPPAHPPVQPPPPTVQLPPLPRQLQPPLPPPPPPHVTVLPPAYPRSQNSIAVRPPVPQSVFVSQTLPLNQSARSPATFLATAPILRQLIPTGKQVNGIPTYTLAPVPVTLPSASGSVANITTSAVPVQFTQAKSVTQVTVPTPNVPPSPTPRVMQSTLQPPLSQASFLPPQINSVPKQAKQWKTCPVCNELLPSNVYQVHMEVAHKTALVKTEDQGVPEKLVARALFLKWIKYKVVRCISCKCFLSEDILATHLLMHGLTCCLCPEVFCSLKSLLEHTKSIHEGQVKIPRDLMANGFQFDTDLNGNLAFSRFDFTIALPKEEIGDKEVHLAVLSGPHQKVVVPIYIKVQLSQQHSVVQQVSRPQVSKCPFCFGTFSGSEIYEMHLKERHHIMPTIHTILKTPAFKCIHCCGVYTGNMTLTAIAVHLLRCRSAPKDKVEANGDIVSESFGKKQEETVNAEKEKTEIKLFPFKRKSSDSAAVTVILERDKDKEELRTAPNGEKRRRVESFGDEVSSATDLDEDYVDLILDPRGYEDSSYEKRKQFILNYFHTQPYPSKKEIEKLSMVLRLCKTDVATFISKKRNKCVKSAQSSKPSVLLGFNMTELKDVKHSLNLS